MPGFVSLPSGTCESDEVASSCPAWRAHRHLFCAALARKAKGPQVTAEGGYGPLLSFAACKPRCIRCDGSSCWMLMGETGCVTASRN